MQYTDNVMHIRLPLRPDVEHFKSNVCVCVCVSVLVCVMALGQTGFYASPTAATELCMFIFDKSCWGV